MMVLSKLLSVYFTSLLIFGFCLLSMPQTSQAGFPMPEIDACCQFTFSCAEIASPNEFDLCVGDGGVVVSNADCDAEVGECEGEMPPSSSSVPTLGEWGLFALAGILGMIGFFVIRRRKAIA